MRPSRWATGMLGLGVLGIYLFATAPAPLPEATRPAGKTVPVRMLFEALANEQAAARATYAGDIVTPGLAQGLKFDETWKERDAEAGPLPAVLLREVASRLQRGGSEVGLFLGSDFPISPVNRFSGAQMHYFDLLKQSGAPQFFMDAGNGRYTAMFIDRAAAQACVNCHNKHPHSPKRDWKLDDPMGATTWLYPREEVSMDELLSQVAQLRAAIRGAYQAYLDRAATFKGTRLQIGTRWPKDGLYLPSADEFMKAVAARTSQNTVEVLLKAAEKKGGPYAESNHANTQAR